MSIITDVLSRLDTVSHPVAQIIQKGKDYRILTVGFKKGMVLKDHKASMPAMLIVLEGKVIYHTASASVVLSQYDQIDIPVELIHSVEALQDSLCILSQGK